MKEVLSINSFYISDFLKDDECFTIPTGAFPKGNRCIFPFKYKGDLHHMCTTEDADKPWCAIDIEPSSEIPEDGIHMGHCQSSCPVIGLYYCY